MALTLGDNFSYLGAKPLDARLKYDTLAAMKAVSDSTMYDGCLAYCVATDKTYQWKSTNTVDEDTGKWREYASGGGHEIKDNGDAVTDRKVMNFTDFDIADDSTNEETDVKVHRLTSAELSDICTPLPGAISDMPVLFDERELEYVIGWYVLANGTKKPVYQKTISAVLSVDTDKEQKITSIDISSLSIDTIINQTVRVSAPASVGNFDRFATDVWGTDQSYLFEAFKSNTNTYSITTNRKTFDGVTAYATIQYTKTTDTPV